ncbi:hypothetical protein BGX31_002180 [Mortierella sp. GBA43]|nr:hypothetical protein BGX31_002180 [Mortierella sp. GBA43]
MSLRKKEGASPHSYATLNLREPDDSPGGAASTVRTSQADSESESEGDQTISTSRGVIKGGSRKSLFRNSHLRRYWIRYVIVVVVLAVITVVTLLIVKPWAHEARMAPITNDAVKEMPVEQPVFPIPRRFEHGKDRVLINQNFQVTVRSAPGDPIQPIGSGSILEKAIGRFMDRLKAKRHATTFSVTPPGTSLVGAILLSELTVIVKDTQAALEFGMVESYTVNITVEDKKRDPVKGDENASVASAVLAASTQWGVIHGLETLIQLVQASKPSSTGSTAPAGQEVENVLEIPNAPWSIQDEPRYSHRGILLDTSRNYFPVKDIIRTLDAMSLVKLNVFHWHVLDQQTYPLVSKLHPDLSAKGAERPDFIYTPEDVAAIIKHGEERGIRILPEFDTPGHAASWSAAYPNITVCVNMQPHAEYGAEPPAGQLDPLEPFTYSVLDGLIKEWAAQFPDVQVHAGGDEVNFNCWKTTDRLRDYIANPNHRADYEKALPPVHQVVLEKGGMKRTKSGSQNGEDKLLETFLDRSLGMYLAQGKRPIVWEELALEHNVKLPDSTIIQVWKSAKNAKRGANQ